MGDELGAESTDCSKGANPDPRGAINQMPATDPRVSFDDELRPAVRLVGEMSAWPARKPGNPIQWADDRVRAQMEEIDILAHREMADTRTFFKNQTARENPGKSDMTIGMN